MKIGKTILKIACWDPHKYINRKTNNYVGGYRFIWYRSWILVLFPFLFWIDFLPKKERNIATFDINHYAKIKTLARVFLILLIVVPSICLIVSFIYSVFIYTPNDEKTVIDQIFEAIIIITFIAIIPLVPLTIIFNTKLRNQNRLKFQNSKKTLASNKDNTSNINNSSNKPHINQNLSYADESDDEEDEEDDEEQRREEALNEGWDEEEMDLEEFENYSN